MRKTRLKVSWLGIPCSSTRIVRNSASFARPNSAMSQQLVATHSVASSAINSISVRSCWAWFFRGSTKGEKHSAKLSKTVPSRIRRHSQNQTSLQRQWLGLSNMRFPCPLRGGWHIVSVANDVTGGGSAGQCADNHFAEAARHPTGLR